MLSTGKLGVIGAGVMGQALIRGLVQTGVVHSEQIWAAARTESSCEEVRKQLGVACYRDYKNELANTEVLLLCVKPSTVIKVLDVLKSSNLPESALIISIAAGTELKYLEQALGRKNPIIRAMPNTPCIVSQGMTVLCAGTNSTSKDMEMAHGIFNAVGESLELEESHFDAVTGLGGSGPAYIYLIIEALADGGVRVGLPREIALKIVTQTVLGAANMVRLSGRHPAALRDDVTTPAGCTIGGLLIMEDGKIRSVLARAVEEATHIAGHLGDNQSV
jgi:pyrroline-5-carboxylate reductase